jgi:hypothetical protein
MSSMVNAHRAGSGGLAKLGEGARTTNDSRVSAGLSRGANLGKKLNAAPWSDTFPAAGSTLDLDFANNRGFVRGVGQGGVMDAITFTRASNGTFVNEQGLLKTTIVNYLGEASNDFNLWTLQRGTLTLNEPDPFGGNNATKFLETTQNDFHGLRRAMLGPSTGPTVLSAYIKPINNDWFWIRIGSQGEAYIQFSTLSVGTTSGSNFGLANIEDVGNGWYRLSIGVNLTGTGTHIINLYSAIADGSNVYAGDVNNGFFVAFAQWELGGEATEYTENFTQQPRFDWASTEQVAQRNLLRFTEQFDSWSLSSVSVVKNTTLTTDPFGGNDASELNATGGINNQYVRQTFISEANTSYTFSVYVKKKDVRYVRIIIFLGGFPTKAVHFDLDDGVVSSDPNNALPTITAAVNGWYRITIQNLPAFSSNGSTVEILQTTSATLNVGAAVGAGTFVYAPQVEIGSTATDYQPIAQPTSTTPLLANPTSNGLLIEEARTNRLFWNRDATQTQWVKTNVTAAKDQTGIDGVANAASSLTATANDGTCIQTITLAAGNRTGSVFLKRLTGTGNIQVTLDGSTYSTVELSDTVWYRIVLSGNVTNPTVGIRLAVSGDAVAMDYGQVEDGLFATSPILTTTATVTRAVDSATINNLSEWINDGVGAIVASCISYVFSNTGATPSRVFSITNGSNNAVNIERSDSGGAFNRVQCFIRTTVGGTINQNFTFIIPGDGLKGGENSVVACNFFPFDLNLVSNFEQTVQNTIPSSYSIRHTGIFALGTMNGTIKRIIYYPKKIKIDGLKELLK